MGKTKGLYKEEFPAGSKVQIANSVELNEFAADWKNHHPLKTEQIKFWGMVALVKSISFYHGGDELYTLEEIPGIWHEECLNRFED